jgi:hypothetical protein
MERGKICMQSPLSQTWRAVCKPYNDNALSGAMSRFGGRAARNEVVSSCTSGLLGSPTVKPEGSLSPDICA